MEKFMNVHCKGAIGNLSKAEFLAEANALSNDHSEEEISAMIGYAGPHEEDEMEDDDDELTTNAGEQREISCMISIYSQPKPEKK